MRRKQVANLSHQQKLMLTVNQERILANPRV
ncbi:hypothetical protein Golob_012212 [Gossypium lobatum]|uniref:Uncharacterized protein n=1 Tax=Gossypium lobatum TaxID=34289 RepID=A0A7J8MRW9_9ROSI|nr:hypothetical protein [Gossypium lobatum]